MTFIVEVFLEVFLLLLFAKKLLDLFNDTPIYNIETKKPVKIKEYTFLVLIVLLILQLIFIHKLELALLFSYSEFGIAYYLMKTVFLEVKENSHKKEN